MIQKTNNTLLGVAFYRKNGKTQCDHVTMNGPRAASVTVLSTER